MHSARPALVIAAHGAATDGWADAVRDFARDVAASPGVRAAFATVEAGFVEHSTPRLADVARLALSAGCPEVLVVPLFLSVSAHTTEDVPGLLGLPVPEHVRRRLVAEGQQPLAPGLPIRLVPLGPIEDLLYRNILRRTRLAARQPPREAIVLCAHGSSLHHDAWDALMHALRTRLMRAGFGYACHAWADHATPASTVADVIVDASRMASIQRVHVLPLYMAVSPLQTTTLAAAATEAARRARASIRYAADAILPDGDLAAHAGLCALEALGLYPSVTGGADA